MMDKQELVYRVEVTREDGWWMVYVPALDALTQAHSWNEVEYMARGLISATLDVDMDGISVDVIVTPDSETERLLSEARAKVEEADRLRSEAVAANQRAAQRLHSAGWSYRLIGRAMHLTHQRVEQLVNGTQRARGA